LQYNILLARNYVCLVLCLSSLHNVSVNTCACVCLCVSMFASLVIQASNHVRSVFIVNIFLRTIISFNYDEQNVGYKLHRLSACVE